MKTIHLALLASVAATPLLAQEAREMDAHVHGVSALEVAVENNVVELNLLSPGMDIVGFEYEASSDADKDAVEAALRTMLLPENIVTFPEAAECRLTEVLAHLHTGDHDHEEGADHEHADHDDHAAGDEHEHEHEEHEHEHDEHAEGGDHDHDEAAGHSEFHARYVFVCEHPEALTTIAFPFFETFENAQEIEAQYVTEAGAGSAEIGRDAAQVTLN